MKSILFPILAFTLLPISSHAVTVSFQDIPGGIGGSLDGLGIDDLPIAFNIPDEPGSTGLVLTVTNITGDNAEFTAFGSRLGITSDSNGIIDLDSDESFTFQFNQSVIITAIDFFSIIGDEAISFAGSTFTVDNTGDGNVATTNFSISANQDIVVAAVQGSVGISTITFDVVPVPEPSSSALITVAFSMLALRRRRV